MDELSNDVGVIETGVIDPVFSALRHPTASPATTGAIDQLAILRASGLITDDQLAAGMRWRSDWMAYTHGVLDARVDAADPVAGVTAKLACHAAKVGYQNVRGGIGRGGEIVLTMLIINGNSPEAIGMKLFPYARHVAARDRWREGCITLIQQLTAQYLVLEQLPHA